MSQWQSQIREHAVWQHLQTLGSSVDQASSREGADSVSLDIVERLRAVTAFIGKRLAAMDPALVPVQAFDALAGQLQSMLSETQNFVSNGQVGHLTNANLYASEALVQLARCPGTVAPDDLTALSEAAAGYRKTMEQIVEQSRKGLDDIRSEVSAVSVKLTELGTDVSTQRSSVTSLTPLDLLKNKGVTEALTDLVKTIRNG